MHTLINKLSLINNQVFNNQTQLTIIPTLKRSYIGKKNDKNKAMTNPKGVEQIQEERPHRF